MSAIMEVTEDNIILFKRKLSELLKDLRFIGTTLEKKTSKYLIQINSEEIDTKLVEKIRIQITNLVQHLKQSSTGIIHMLQSDVTSINSSSQNLLSKLHTTLCEVSENLTKADKGTMTLSTTNDQFSIESEANVEQTDSSEPLICSNINGLSLKRATTSDTQHTDDDLWKDTLQRASGNLSASNLVIAAESNKKFDKIDTESDEILEELLAKTDSENSHLLGKLSEEEDVYINTGTSSVNKKKTHKEIENLKADLSSNENDLSNTESCNKPIEASGCNSKNGQQLTTFTQDTLELTNGYISDIKAIARDLDADDTEADIYLQKTQLIETVENTNNYHNGFSEETIKYPSETEDNEQITDSVSETEPVEVNVNTDAEHSDEMKIDNYDSDSFTGEVTKTDYVSKDIISDSDQESEDATKSKVCSNNSVDNKFEDLIQTDDILNNSQSDIPTQEATTINTDPKLKEISSTVEINIEGNANPKETYCVDSDVNKTGVDVDTHSSTNGMNRTDDFDNDEILMDENPTSNEIRKTETDYDSDETMIGKPIEIGNNDGINDANPKPDEIIDTDFDSDATMLDSDLKHDDTDCENHETVIETDRSPKELIHSEDVILNRIEDFLCDSNCAELSNSRDKNSESQRSPDFLDHLEPSDVEMKAADQQHYVQLEKNDHYNQSFDALLDLEMEEILPNCENVETNVSCSQNTIIYEVDPLLIKPDPDTIKPDPDTIKPDPDKINLDPDEAQIAPDAKGLLKNESIENSSFEIKDEYTNQNTKQDINAQLLKLLQDVDRSEIDYSKKAEQILIDLEEIESDLSSSDDSDIHFNISDTSCSSDDDPKIFPAKESNDIAGKRELYIELERMDMVEKLVKQYTKNSDKEIDRLCDLNTLNKRKHITSSPDGKKRMKKSKKSSSSNSSTSTSTDSDNDVISDLPKLDEKMKDQLDEMLANSICKNLKNGSSESSIDSDSADTDSTEAIEKKKMLTDKKQYEKRQLTKEELEKQAWKNDPLLKGKISDSDTDKSKSKKKKESSDTEGSIKLNTPDSDSSSDMKLKNKARLKKIKVSPIKRNLIIDSSSDSDSDVQYISPKKMSPNSETAAASVKGRRHIRHILSDQDLTQETQCAKKEEMRRIERLKERSKIIESFSQSLESQTVEKDEVSPLILDIDEKTGDPLVQVNKIITAKLKPHQREGIQFMWDSCYESLERVKQHRGSGCILAHCMGLGKTFQVLALVHTLFSVDETNTKHVLIVCPLSTVNNWIKEVKFAYDKLSLDFSIYSIMGDQNHAGINSKSKVVLQWFRRQKSILVLSYDSFENLTNPFRLRKLPDTQQKLLIEALNDPGPDLVVCDEGHLIKNSKSLKSIALQKIKTKRRIVLTGTPLQNNLEEYYHMVQFVKPNLLGNINEFKTNFINPITNGQFEDSNEFDINLMMKRTHVLHKLLLKTVQRMEDTELSAYIPPMLDHAVFIQLTQLQVDLYNYYAEMSTLNAQENRNKRREILSDYINFLHISSHPHVLVFNSLLNSSKRKETEVIYVDPDQPLTTNSKWWIDKLPKDSLDQIAYGNKLVVLKAIIEECEAIGDKLLVFSQFLGELDLIEHYLQKIGTEKTPLWKKHVDYFRMDGHVPPVERSRICDKFNDPTRTKIKLLLMATRVGGLGLNLTAANRVVIMSVQWNPSYDTQSVFRVYRFGQQKKVYVYRLVALGTIEEKVYQRQVTKLAQSHRVVDKHQITRHYKSVDLQELYSCRPTADNERPIPNVPDDEMLAELILNLPCIFKYHEHKSLLVDRPEDKLSEQELATAWEDFKNKDTFNPENQPAPQLGAQNMYYNPTYDMAYNLGKTTKPVFDPYTKKYSVPNPSIPVDQHKQFRKRTHTLASNTTNNTFQSKPGPSRQFRNELNTLSQLVVDESTPRSVSAPNSLPKTHNTNKFPHLLQNPFHKNNGALLHNAGNPTLSSISNGISILRNNITLPPISKNYSVISNANTKSNLNLRKNGNSSLPAVQPKSAPASSIAKAPPLKENLFSRQFSATNKLKGISRNVNLRNMQENDRIHQVDEPINLIDDNSTKNNHVQNGDDNDEVITLL